MASIFARFQDGVLPAWGREAALLQHGGRTWRQLGQRMGGRPMGEHGEEEEATNPVRRGLAVRCRSAQRRLAEWPPRRAGRAGLRTRHGPVARHRPHGVLLPSWPTSSCWWGGHGGQAPAGRAPKITQAPGPKPGRDDGSGQPRDLEAQLRAGPDGGPAGGRAVGAHEPRAETPLTGVMGVLDSAGSWAQPQGPSAAACGARVLQHAAEAHQPPA